MPPLLTAPLILASASPRRQEILRLAGIEFEVEVSAAEAHLGRAASPRCQAEAGARAKAEDVARRHPGRVVVGADTVVALGNRLLEKPRDEADARRMLRELSGRRHEVFTVIVLAVGESGGAELLYEECATSLVSFRRLAEAEIDAYVATGDPLDKAGAYGIQSGGGELVAEVWGSYLNVVGLPLARLRLALSAIGWAGPSERADED
ncbi:MAG: Maf family protein [Armatimonadia bacterium]